MLTFRQFSRTCVLMLISLCVGVAVSCHRDGLSREERRARKAAEQYYTWLEKGKTEKFVEHIVHADSMSPAYRTQMCDLVNEYLCQLEEQHGKLTGVEAVGQVLTERHAHVFVQLSFADSTTEEVGVPLILEGGEWLMQ